MIRAHGVKPEVFEQAQERELEIIDGTCSWVIQEQRQLQQLVEEGYTIVLLGTPKHPEVVGLLGFAPDAIVVDEEEDWDRIPRRKRMALITQSTQPPWKFEKLAAFMVSRAHELKIVNTVCPVTIRRQQDTMDIAGEVDLMVVVGGRHSANTKELTRLCEIAGTRAIQIENARDLGDPAPFDGRARGRRDRRHLDPDRGPARGRRADLRDRRDAGQAGARDRALDRRPRRRRASRRPHHVAAPDARRRRRGRARCPPAPDCRSSPSSAGPNVGKSTLFNRVVGDARAAIVEDRARTTRDRMYGDAEWNGRRFVVVDTGGLEIAPGDPIEAQVQIQARLAIGEADVIVFLVDAVTGLTPADTEAADILRRSTKPVLVAPNKADNERRELDAAEFYSLGWEETIPISANHGRGVADLLDAVVWAMPPESEQEIARKAREAEADAWEKDMRAGRIDPYVVGESGNDGDDDGEDEPRMATRPRTGWPRPSSRPAGTPRWRPRATSRRRSRSWAGRTSASRRC